MGLFSFLFIVCVQYVHVWSWKIIIKQVAKGRVGNTFVCGEKHGVPQGFVMKIVDLEWEELPVTKKRGS